MFGDVIRLIIIQHSFFLYYVTIKFVLISGNLCFRP